MSKTATKRKRSALVAVHTPKPVCPFCETPMAPGEYHVRTSGTGALGERWQVVECPSCERRLKIIFENF